MSSLWQRRELALGVYLVMCLSLRCKQPAPAPDGSSASLGPITAAGAAELRASWQGAWVIRSGPAGEPEAWLVEGDRVTITGRAGEPRRYRLQVVADCKLGLTSEGIAASTTSYHAFAFDRDQLYAGSSRAGVRRADRIVACSLSGIYVHVAGQCHRWDEQPRDGRWTRTALSCALRSQDGKQHFVAEDPAHGAERFLVDGGILVHHILGRAEGVARRFADIETARRALKAGAR